MGKLALEAARERLKAAKDSRPAAPRFRQKGPKTFAKKARGVKNKSASGRAFPKGSKVQGLRWSTFGALTKGRKVRRWRAIPGVFNHVRIALALERAKGRTPGARAELRRKLNPALCWGKREDTLFDACSALSDFGNSVRQQGRHAYEHGDPVLSWLAASDNRWQRTRVDYQTKRVQYWTP